MDTGSHILIADDETDIRDVIRLLLEMNGYTVAEAADGSAAADYAARHPELDLIILDVLMPGMSGYDTCRILRNYTNAPILFLTAKSAESDRLDAYQCGGDDFLAKPFSQAMLLAKVSTLLRRYKLYRGKPDHQLIATAITLDPQHRTASKEGRALDLTEKEYAILACLAAHRGSAVSAQELYEQVWHEKYLPASTNTIMVHILNLRKKVEEDASNPKIIRTVWGKGYQID